MKYVLILFLSIVVFGVIFHFLTRKYINPYKLYMVFGKKGSGKTTMLEMLASKYLKQGRTVYSTVPIKGTFAIEPQHVGKYEFEPDSVVLIDEAGMCYDNRKFKSFSDETRDWYKLQRHRHLIVYLFSQDFDIDLKLRTLTDEMWLVRKFFRVFSVSRRIDRTIVLNKSTADAPSSIAENLTFVPIIMPNSIRIIFLPAHVGKFDSFAAPPLLRREFKQYAFDEQPPAPPLSLLARIRSLWPTRQQKNIPPASDGQQP